MLDQLQSMVDATTARHLLRLNWIIGTLYINRFVDTLNKQWLNKRLEVVCG